MRLRSVASSPSGRHSTCSARLTNPAGTRRQLVGVPQSELTELMARSLLLLGSERAWVVHGADGIDEMSTTGHTKVSECRNGAVSTFYVHPSDFGMPKADRSDLKGGDAATNAAIRPRDSRRREGTTSRCRAVECRRLALRRRAGGVGSRGHRAGRRGHRFGCCQRASSTRWCRIAKREPSGAARMKRKSAKAGPMTSTVHTPDLLAAIVAATRRIVCGPLGRHAVEELERRAAAVEPRPGAFPAGAGTGRPRQRDCRVQAPVALARCAEGGLRSGGDCRRLRTRRRGGHFCADRADVLRRLARSPRAVRRATGLPILRKDFIVDRYQDSRGAGGRRRCDSADCGRVDDRDALRSLHHDGHRRRARRARGDSRLRRVADRARAGASIIGVNNRNLRTLAVDTDVSDAPSS